VCLDAASRTAAAMAAVKRGQLEESAESELLVLVLVLVLVPVLGLGLGLGRIASPQHVTPRCWVL
jgi:hypothetical protein